MNKLCINYTQPEMEHIEEAEQIKIDESRLNDETLEQFLENNADKHIYITIESNIIKDITKMRKLQEIKKYDNWTLQIPIKLIMDDNYINETRFSAIKDCCNKYMFTDLIGQWEILQFIISLKPSEVYITNILGFDLVNINKVCGGIGVRVYANWAQSAWDDSPSIKKFFIRPEDIVDYEPYVSGIEFIGDANVQEVVFGAYSRGYWYGDLNEIIIGFEDSLDSRRLPHEFGANRIQCGKRCIQGRSCNLCRVMHEFVERMEKTETQIVPRAKNKE